jgi:zinc protease
MQRLLVLLVLASVSLGACVPGQAVFVAPEAGAAVPASASAPITSSEALAMPGDQAAGATPALPASPSTPTGSPAALATPGAQEAVTPTVTTTQTTHQWQLADRLPLDPTVHEGKLANGLTYIIRQNAQPQDRAELRLVVNAGSVLEDADQQGLAHFLEHMLFNGTCHFPKQAIQDFLESNGMRFGADLNASTGADQTVYVLRIPLDKPQVLDTALNILVDWASCATLDPVQMDRERGVIMDEYRLREQNAQGRLNDQLIKQLMAGSPYADRLPIGDMNIVQNASVDTLRRFYTTWYRPDLMAVIAAGNFDAGQVEQMVKQKFASIPAHKDAPPRPTFQIPNFVGTHYLVATDPENPDSSVQVFVRQPAPGFGTVALYRASLVQNLFYSMLNQRYKTLIQAGNAPFTSADSGLTQIVRTAYASVIEAQVQATNTVPALDSLMTEVERVRQYGFTAPELAQAKSALLEGYRSAYAGRSTRDTTDVVDELERHFLTGEDVPGIAIENEIANQFVPQITLQEVNQEVQKLAGTDDRLVAVLAPEKQGFTPPTEQDLSAAMQAAASKDLRPYVAQTPTEQLMTDIPQAAAVVTRTTISDLNVTEITLANGVHVIMKPTTFSADEVLFSGVAPGGSSLVPDADVPAARFISKIVASSGVGKFTKTQLDQILAGKSVSVTPDIRELTQRIDGSASPRDLETAFQLIYLYATQPRVDPSAVKAAQDAAQAQLADRALAPESALEDALTSLEYGDAVRRQPFVALADIQAMNVQHAFQIYQDRFSDMGGFTFTFVGNFDVAQLTNLAQRYLGNLPSQGRVDAWADKLPGPASGVHTRNIYQGKDNRGVAEIVFPGPFTDTPENAIRLSLVGDVLDLEMTAQLRLKLGASYSPSVDTAVEHWPHAHYAVGIAFTSDPTVIKSLLDVVFNQIDSLRTSGPSTDDVAKAKEQEKRSLEEAMRQNSFWLTTLVNYALDPQHQDPRTVLRANDLIDQVTAQDLRQAAQQYLNPNQYIQVVLYPASQEPNTGTTVLVPGAVSPVAMTETGGGVAVQSVIR